MEFEIFSLQRFYEYLIILARMAAMVGSLPIFTGSRAAVRLRLGLAVGISLVIFPLMDLNLTEHQTSPIGFFMIMIQEVFLGLLLGFVVQLIFFAVQFGATIVGYQMGFSAAEILDPQHQQQVPLLSQFQNILAIMLFLALNIHHVLLRAMVDSYAVLPPGKLNFSGNAIPYIISMTGEMFVLGLKLVMPVLALLMVSMFILGIMSRVFSQLQVFMLSFPINISLALIILGLSMGMIFTILGNEFQGLHDHILYVLRLL